MSLPKNTKMCLIVSYGTGLEKLVDTNTHGRQVSRTDAENKVEDAKYQLQKEYRMAGDADDISHAIKRVTYAQTRLGRAEAQLKNVAGADDKVVPNPFVVVSIDGNDEDVRPMLYTKVIRGTCNPIWKEKFEQFPLGMYLTGKTGYEMYHNDEPNYRPRNLVFYIYHDDAIPDNKNRPKESDETWERDNPQQGIPIGKAIWNFEEICRYVDCGVFEKDLQVLNPGTNRKIKEATLNIKIRLSVPRIRTKLCRCVRNRPRSIIHYRK